ncbi:uncharacterized protein NPIL_91961 [Nephila pilipes]|uniref:Ionotropic glutamate receptor L-glutamate and glycine-binding domain-containing protein n=1 Tax=Nephila pilipes TaxID=299642 RepID=A0A8X6TYG7_NEPPI|nr:uncharacterized protein NPIL_91961 [Nephila pilipes]
MNYSQKLTVLAVPVRYVFQVNRSNDGEMKFNYIEGLFFQEVMNALGLQFDIIFPVNNVYGVELKNGSWTGMIGMLQKEEADLAFTYVSITDARSKVVGFSKTYTYSELTFVSHIPKDSVKPMFAFVHPFDLATWGSLFVLLFAISFLFSKFQQGKLSIGLAFFKLFASLLHQPLNISDNAVKNNILELFWCLFALVISFGYCSILLSFLIQPSKPPYIRTFGELSSAVQIRRTLKCCTKRNS